MWKVLHSIDNTKKMYMVRDHTCQPVIPMLLGILLEILFLQKVYLRRKRLHNSIHGCLFLHRCFKLSLMPMCMSLLSLCLSLLSIVIVLFKYLLLLQHPWTFPNFDPFYTCSYDQNLILLTLMNINFYGYNIKH